MAKIHPSALVDKNAVLASDVEVGPFCIIGPKVQIDSGTKVSSHTIIEGKTFIGKNCVIFPSAFIGLRPQDKKFQECDSGVVIGNDNVIRENVTIHPATEAGKNTILGDRNLIMIGAHIAHDCVLGNDNTIVNNVAIAGFVTIEDKVTVGGNSGVHQFVHLGKYAMIGGLTKVVQDVAPFSVCDGNPARCVGANKIGLQRAGFSLSEITKIRKAIKILFCSGGNLTAAVERVKAEGLDDSKEVQYLLSFIGLSKRGIVRGKALASSKSEERDAVES